MIEDSRSHIHKHIKDHNGTCKSVLVSISQVCEPQNQGVILYGWEAVEKAFKEKEIYQVAPLKYKWNFAKEKELGVVFQEGAGRQAGLTCQLTTVVG